jgi:hypothetical protein
MQNPGCLSGSKAEWLKHAITVWLKNATFNMAEKCHFRHG